MRQPVWGSRFVKAPIIKGPVIVARVAAIPTPACAAIRFISIPVIYENILAINLPGRHLRGRISLGTAYASGTDAKPAPIRILAPINRSRVLEPGAMQAPTNDIAHEPTSNSFRAWKVSDRVEMIGPRTPCIKERQTIIQAWDSVSPRSRPM